MKIFGTVAMTVYMLMIAASDPAEAEPPRHDRDSAQIGALQSYTTGKEDTLLEIARRFDLGFVELLAANPGIDPWVPGAGIKITLPTAHLLPLAPRRGIVLNLAEQRLYFFPPDGGKILTFPVGTGMAGYEMPLTTTRVSGKRINPTWVPPASIRAERPELPASIPPGPDNPLGAYAIDLALSEYLIHGTNKPFGIGRRVSHGCTRLYPEDIATLFPLVKPGTTVAIVNQPVKMRWVEGELYMEIHPTQTQADEIEATGLFTPEQIPELEFRTLQISGNQSHRLNWPLIHEVATKRLGIPIRVTVPKLPD